MKQISHTIAALLLLANFLCHAQIVNEKRIEFDLKDDYNNYSLTAFGKNGLLLYANNRSKDEWLIEKYDIRLESTISTTIPVERKKSLDKAVENEDKLNLFFKSKSNKYTLYNISSTNLKYLSKSGTLPKKANVDLVVEYNNIVYISMKKNKYPKPMLFMVNYDTDLQSIVPLTFSGYRSKHLTVVGIEAIPEYKEVLIYVHADNGRAADMFIIKMDENGEKIETIKFSSKEQKYIKTVSGSALGNGEYLFSGTYSSKNGKSAQGMYVSKFSGKKINFITYVNFSEFDDFFSYLDEKDQSSIQHKIERKNSKGKEANFNYLLTIHKVRKIDDKYILLAEAYYPTFRSETVSTGTNSSSTRLVFDGYIYTHASLSAFTSDGERLWDRTFPLALLEKPYTVKKYVRMNIQENQINLMCATGKYLDLMTVSEDNEMVKDLKTDFIKTEDEEKIKRSYSNLQYWYDDYFVAFGFQSIKGENRGRTKNRTVFFINKIGIE